MKQKQLFLILSVVGILLWVYGIYSSIPLVKHHLNFNTLKMILENMLSLESFVTPLGFIIVIVGAVINQKIAVAVGSVISLIMTIYAVIENGSAEIIPIMMMLVSIIIIVLSLAGKNLKLK